MTSKAVAMNQRRVHPLTPALITSHVTILRGIILLVIMVHAIIRPVTTHLETIPLEIIRHVILAHVTAIILRVNQHETRHSFEDFLKRLFVASLAVDWKSSFAFCCDLCVWSDGVFNIFRHFHKQLTMFCNFFVVSFNFSSFNLREPLLTSLL